MCQPEKIDVNKPPITTLRVYITVLTSFVLTAVFGLEVAAQFLTTIERNGPSGRL